MTELQIFESADKDYNGRLTFLELTVYAKSLNKPSMVQEWFDKFDTDRKGYITIADLERVLKKPKSEDYGKHVDARALTRQTIQGATTKYRSEQLEEKAKSMPYFFSAVQGKFLAKGVPQGDPRELCKQGRLCISESTHKILFDGQPIGELDSQLKFTRTVIDKKTGDVYIDGLNHGSMADLFYCDILMLGQSRENYEIAVVYSIKHDLLFVNGHFLGKLDNLYSSKKFTFDAERGLMYYSDILIGYSSTGKFDKLKEEENKLSFNGTKSQTPSEHVKQGTLTIRRAGEVPKLGHLYVNPNTTQILLNDQSLGNLGELIQNNTIKISPDRMITYKDVPIGCLDDQLPAGKYIYKPNDKKLYCEGLPIGELDDMLERRQICLAGMNRGRPRLIFNQKDQHIFLDSYYLGEFNKICSSKLLQIDANSQSIYYSDVELARMPQNWRDYNINTISGGFVHSDEKLERFQDLYFAAKNVSKPSKGGSVRRVIISSNTREVFLDGERAGTVDELLDQGRLKLDFKDHKILLDDLDIAPLVDGYVTPDQMPLLKKNPEAFLRLYNYCSSTYILPQEDAVYENGMFIGKLTDIIKTARINYDPARGCFAMEEDYLAYVTGDRSKVSIDTKKGLIKIGDKSMTMLDAIKANEIYVHTSPYDYNINKLKVYSSSELKIDQPIADVRNLLQINDPRLRYHDKDGGVVTLNQQYLVNKPKDMREDQLALDQNRQIGSLLSDTVLTQLFNDKNRTIFHDVSKYDFRDLTPAQAPIAVVSSEQPRVVHAAAPSMPPIQAAEPPKPKPAGYSVNGGTMMLESNGKEVGKLQDLISKGQLKADMYRGCLTYNNERVCYFSPTYWQQMDPAKLTPPMVVSVFNRIRYDSASKQLYRGPNSLGKLSDKINGKLIKQDRQKGEIQFEGQFLSVLPPSNRKFDFKFDESDSMVAIGPLGEAYLDATTNQRYVHCEPKEKYFSSQRKFCLKQDGAIYDTNDKKVGTLDELIKAGRLTYKPRKGELQMDECLLMVVDGDVNRFKFKYDLNTFKLSSADTEEIKRLARSQELGACSPPYIARQLRQGTECVELKDALKEITVDLPSGELRRKNVFIGQWPMDCNKVSVASNGTVACQSPDDFLVAYQQGMREHHGGIYDVDYSTGMCYLRDYPMGTLLELTNQGRFYADQRRQIVTLNGHYFCPLLSIYKSMGFQFDPKTGQISGNDVEVLTTLHRITSATRLSDLGYPDYAFYDMSKQTIYMGADKKTVKLADLSKTLSADDAGRVLLSNGALLTYLPTKMSRNTDTGLDNKGAVKDAEKFSKFLPKALIDSRLLRLSGQFKPYSTRWDAAQASLKFDNTSPVKLDKLMSENRLCYDMKRETLLADGCLVSKPEAALMLSSNVKMDPVYGSVKSITGDFAQYTCSEQDLEPSKCFMLHDSNLNYLINQKRLRADNKLGVLYFDDHRVGFFNNSITDNVFAVKEQDASVMVNGKPVGTVEDCFDRGQVSFEYEFLQAADAFKVNKSYLQNKSNYDSEYKENKSKGKIIFYDPKKPKNKILEDTNIVLREQQQIPLEILEFTVKEIKDGQNSGALEKDLAKNLKMKLDAKFGRVWQAIASRSTIGCKVSHFEDMFLNIEHKGVTYILFRTPDYN